MYDPRIQDKNNAFENNVTVNYPFSSHFSIQVLGLKCQLLKNDFLLKAAHRDWSLGWKEVITDLSELWLSYLNTTSLNLEVTSQSTKSGKSTRPNGSFHRKSSQWCVGTAQNVNEAQAQALSEKAAEIIGDSAEMK